VKRHICYAWVEFTNATREGSDLGSIEEMIGSIIAYNDGGLLLADFTFDGRIEINPLHFTSLQQLNNTRITL